jgi:DNA-binding transcriptional LysR family regulator
VEWDDVRVMLALFRASNLHDAGRSLGMNASTVSRRLAALEERMGGQLFARTRDGLRPTAAAERLRPHAERMETDAAALAHAMRADTHMASGVVRVATTESFARILAHNGLLGVRSDHPDIVVELLAGNRPVDLGRGEADLAIRMAALRQQALRGKCLATMGVALFASPEYLRVRGFVNAAGDLTGHDVLLPAGELSQLPEAKWLARQPGVRVVFRSNCMPALLEAAQRGAGIVPLPIGWGKSERGLEALFELESAGKRKIWLVAHDAASRRPEVRVVSKHIAAICERVFAG